MKFIISTILIALISFVTCLYLPWWSIAIAAFVVAAFLRQRPVAAFLAGFIALFGLWVVLASMISSNNEHILAHKMSELVLKSDNPSMLIILTGAIGAFVAGFAALSGSLLAGVLKGSKK